MDLYAGNRFVASVGKFQSGRLVDTITRLFHASLYSSPIRGLDVF